MIEQVNGKILPPFHERLQALVDEYSIDSLAKARTNWRFIVALQAVYIRHNLDLVEVFIKESLPDVSGPGDFAVSSFLSEAMVPVCKRIIEDFEDYWHNGQDDEVLPADTKVVSNIDPLEPAKDLAEMRAKDVIKEARG